MQYLLKYDDLFSEFLYLLNEGYINSQIEEFDYINLDFTKQGHVFLDLDELKQIPHDLRQELASVFSYGNEITMNFSIQEKLALEGARDFEFKNRNYSIHAKDIDVMSKTGNVSIKYLLSSFEKGIKKFIVAPLTTKDKGTVYIFSTTPKYKDLLENKAQQKKALKKTFSKVKGDYAPSFPKYNNEQLEQMDLVEFIYGKKQIRGYIDEVLNFASDFEQYLEENRMMLGMESDFLINFKKKANVNFHFTADEFYAADYIVKALRNTKTSENYDYYAVNKNHILTYFPMNTGEIGESIAKALRLGKEMNPTITCHLNKVNNVEEKANAYYTPFENSITINLERIINSCFENYTLYGYHPNDFVTCVCAHELGHSDLRGIHLFDDRYASGVKMLNKLREAIAHDIEQIECSIGLDSEILHEVLNKCKKRVELLQHHYDVVMQTEMNAYVYGLDYISCDNIKRLFQKNNYDTYTSYLEEELRPLRKAQRQLYGIQRLIELFE